MPIYEFYCDRCHTIYNFFSRTVDTRKVPFCPHCKTRKLSRQVSLFAIAGRAREEGDDELPFDESQMEQAMHLLAREADRLDENDPRQAAGLMRKLSDMTGVELGAGMQEALARMERGEDPEQIESELGDLLESEEPFLTSARKGPRLRRRAPRKDDTLYDL